MCDTEARVDATLSHVGTPPPPGPGLVRLRVGVEKCVLRLVKAEILTTVLYCMSTETACAVTATFL
jgi:hypothetical protein